MRLINIKNSFGFTLVELAISMVIIGLLITGVLKGQELLESARSNATIKQVNAFTAAVNIFQDKYQAYPGDLMNAGNRIPGCGGTCYGGNQDGIVGLLATPGNYQSTQAGTGSSPRVETTMFWKQMAYADLITGIDPAANVAMPEYGHTHPASPLGGGYDVFFAPADLVDTPGGLVFRLQNALAFSGTSTVFISPAIAERIDLKMDDGFPDTGYVRADFDQSGCDPGNAYRISSNASCIMYFTAKR